MSLHEYRRSQELERADEPFYALVMAAMRKADTENLYKLREAFPEVWTELSLRYNAPGGHLPSDDEGAVIRVVCGYCGYPPNSAPCQKAHP